MQRLGAPGPQKKARADAPNRIRAGPVAGNRFDCVLATGGNSGCDVHLIRNAVRRGQTAALLKGAGIRAPIRLWRQSPDDIENPVGEIRLPFYRLVKIANRVGTQE